MQNLTNTREVKTLGLLGEGEYFSFPDAYQDAPEIYIVLKQLDELSSIKAQHGTNVFFLPKHIKVYVWTILH